MGTDIHMFVEKKTDKWELVKRGVSSEWIYDNRNYFLFALLADVRNNFGIKPIKDLRLYPTDFSEETLKELEKHKSWTHSLSYYTLEELLEFNWEQTVTKEGYVKLKDFLADEKHSYCGGVYGSDVVTIHQEDFKYNMIEKDKDYYILISWEETYAEAASDFHKQVIEEMKKMGQSRIIFCFDN